VLPETDAQKIVRLEQENAALRARMEELEAEVRRLKQLLEDAVRAAKRQAAPFSRQRPKANPQSPGRKPGKAYGQRCRRPIPKTVEETVEVPIPQNCPYCQGAVQKVGVVSQYQEEIPEPRVERTEFRIHVGRCEQCGKRVQGRHPRQSSNAVGSAGVGIGPRALALAVELNKDLGLPYGKTVRVLQQAFGLQMSRGGVCQAVARVARKAEPSYQVLVHRIRSEPSVTADETGWKVGGHLHWAWVFVSSRITVYSIQPGRGYEQAKVILGDDFDGFLVRDGWNGYRRFTDAVHQSCVAHLLRRCREMILAAGEASLPAQFPRTVQSILQQGLHVRDRRDQDLISTHGLAVARGRLEAQMDRILAWDHRSEENQRLANHLRRERDWLFPFLYCEGLEATNWRAEQALRPLVVTRKVWGGNRTETGAYTQSILSSTLQTCRQQMRSYASFVRDLVCSPQPPVIDLTDPINE
jgi:transposase